MKLDFESNFDEIVALLIMKGRASLTEKNIYITVLKKPYNPMFTKIALEYD